MSPKDLSTAIVVILAWNVNFVVIKLGMHGVPPMLLGALRAFFVKRPQIPLCWCSPTRHHHHFFEGPALIESSFAHIPWVSVAAIAYLWWCRSVSFVAAIFDYSL